MAFDDENNTPGSYKINTGGRIATYSEGLILTFVPNTSNIGASTLVVDSLGSKAADTTAQRSVKVGLRHETQQKQRVGLDKAQPNLCNY